MLVRLCKRLFQNKTSRTQLFFCICLHLPTAFYLTQPLSILYTLHQLKINFVSGFALLTFPSFDDSLNLEASDGALLGNDFVFFTAFLTSFLFNWIGFLLLMCFCHTIAARFELKLLQLFSLIKMFSELWGSVVFQSLDPRPSKFVQPYFSSATQFHFF